MKIDCLKILSGVVVLCAFLVGCEPEQNPVDPATDVTVSQVLILNEGSYQGNNAGITVYDPDAKAVTVDELYSMANGVRMGDTGQDILVDGDDVYVCVYGSSYVARLDMSGKNIAQHLFTEEEGQPRYMAVSGDNIYVTLYSGNVAVMDRMTLDVKKLIGVGSNPEGIVCCDGKLYVANSGWGDDQTISVIDIAREENVQTIQCAVNPQQFVVVDGNLFLFAYGPYDENWNCPYPVQAVDRATGVVSDLCNAIRGTVMGFDKLLLLRNETDWSTYTTTNTFFTYDVTTNTLSASSPFRDAPDEVLTGSIYMMECDVRTGEVYIGVSDYVTAGTVYRFSATGYLLDKFTVGINPSQAAFFGQTK